MYEEHIRAAARSMAENMQRSPVPMYGKGLRLPDKGAVIGLLKEIRRLVFPAYYGDPELMTLLAEDYTALLLERIEGQLTRQIALALPEEQEQRAPMLAREVVEALPGVQRLLLTDLDATFESDPAAASKEEILFAYPGLFAIFVYRVAHELYLRQIPMIPRIMSRVRPQPHGHRYSPRRTDRRPLLHRSRHRHRGGRDHGHRGECEAVSGRDAGSAVPSEGPCQSAGEAASHRGQRRDHLLRGLYSGR